VLNGLGKLEFVGNILIYIKITRMKTIVIYFNLLFAFFLVACRNQDVSSKNELSVKPEITKDLEAQIASIENTTDLKMVNSLAYNNNAGSTEEVTAYIDAKGETLKLEERFLDVKTGNFGTIFFYVLNQKTIGSREVFFDNTLKNPSFIERITYYDAKQQPIYSKSRCAETEEALIKASFGQIKAQGVSVERALRVINQRGEFSTTFQGFLQSGGLTYILVGENTQDGFVSALVVQYQNADLVKLQSNERGMIGTPLQIKHQTLVDEKGLKFQVLLELVINS
jgi:hypothetical protein